MAVENKYTNADVVALKEPVPGFANVGKQWAGVGIAEVANGDSNNSVYRVFKGLNSELCITDLKLDHDAFGVGGTLSVGIFETTEDGAEIDDNCFASAVSIAAAAKQVNGLAAVDPADAQKRLWEIAGHTLATKKASYDIAIKVTNVGATAEGTIAARLEALQA
jgi:hypothetical protein